MLAITESKIDKILESGCCDGSVEDEKHLLEKLVQLKYILEKDKLEGLSRKVQLKPLKSEQRVDSKTKKVTTIVTEALFILKWGGELTHSGVNQALHWGQEFRERMYVEKWDQ